MRFRIDSFNTTINIGCETLKKRDLFPFTYFGGSFREFPVMLVKLTQVLNELCLMSDCHKQRRHALNNESFNIVLQIKKSNKEIKKKI